MEKPLPILMEETKQSIVDTINNSGLPMYIMEGILRDLQFAVHEAAQNELEQAKKYMAESKQEEESK